MIRILRRATTLLLIGLATTTGASAQIVPNRDSTRFGRMFPLPTLSPQETRLIGQSHWQRGVPAVLRILTTNHQTSTPVRATVTISISGPIKPLPTTPNERNRPPSTRNAANTGFGEPDRSLPVLVRYQGQTNADGALETRLNNAPLPVGAYQLIVSTTSPLGKDEIARRIEIEEQTQIYLTSDKPVYQPGQTMHLRALALDPATRHAVEGQSVVFEVEDGRGNKVFKKHDTLSAFGLVNADFVLATEVNQGDYTLRVALPTTRAEKKVRVEQYQLPKFRLVVTTERPYYLPGEVVKGTVQADYFFGKPAANSPVMVTLSLPFLLSDRGTGKQAVMEGRTDANGTFSFTYTLPRDLVGRSIDQGKATLTLEARVTDTANHIETANRTLPVVSGALQIALVPETQRLMPGLRNRFYMAVASPDGTPIPAARLTISSNVDPNGSVVTTDALGMATCELLATANLQTITVRAAARDGRSGSLVRYLGPLRREEGILLRTDRSLVKVGDSVAVSALVPKTDRSTTVYFDVTRYRQTILTIAKPSVNGQASFSLPITGDMAGTLEVHAYRITRGGEIVRDSRRLVVQSADELTIHVSADQAVYRPGADAALRFSVQDRARRPVSAALGVAIVDESVFALSELQPGLEKAFFTLEKELMEPKVEIHGLKASDVLLRPVAPAEKDAARQRAAALLLAAVPSRTEYDLNLDTYTIRWEKFKSAAQTEATEAYRKIVNAILQYQHDRGLALTREQGLFYLVQNDFLRVDDLIDPWGHFYRTNFRGGRIFTDMFSLSSAGPDGKWGTQDDLKDITSTPWRLGSGGFSVGGGIGGGGIGGGFGGGYGGGGLGGIGGGGPGAGYYNPRGGGAGPPRDLGGNILSSAYDIENTVLNRAGSDGAQAEPRVRSFFPETLYWNPALITDEQGQAELRITMADSITDWRLSLTANSQIGQLGSVTTPIRAFQDFFVDIDVPVALTQNDYARIPVSIYNYQAAAQEVTITLDTAPWFTLQGQASQTVRLAKDEVRVVYFPLVANAIGPHTLTVTARSARLSDAVRRPVEVLPDGMEHEIALNERVKGAAERTVTIPDNAIPGASTLWLKLYPGMLSQLVEGLEGILQSPHGCFEQTSSSTYPNVLVLAYLKQTMKLNPKLQRQAELFINEGYQRLVTFEVPGGGFSLYGKSPASPWLTAYGLLEFADMATVREVDPALIKRTQDWLVQRQMIDGWWDETLHGQPDVSTVHRHTLRSTAYAAWALAASGYQGKALTRALAYLRDRKNELTDSYTLALVLNLLVTLAPDDPFTSDIAQSLIALAKHEEGMAFWTPASSTFTGAIDLDANLETTALAAAGLARWHRDAALVDRALTYLLRARRSTGAWPTTQTTILALKALLLARFEGGGDGTGTVTVFANGTKAATIAITPADNDVMRQIDLTPFIQKGENPIRVEFSGKGSLLYQLAGRYYIPWRVDVPPVGKPPLNLRVDYDRTTLAQNETVTATVTLTNTTDRVVETPLLDVGIPPGFTVQSDKLDMAVANLRISKYSLTPRQVIVYMTYLAPGETLTLQYDLKARFPIRAQSPLSQAYPYYNPEQTVISPPQRLVVRE